MKILLVSDSHSDDETLRRIAIKHNDCDFYIHLGDSQSSKDNIAPFISVKGNCDYFSNDFAKSIELDTPFGKLFAEHIPFYQISMHKLIKKGYKIYLHGHTHIKRNELVDGIRIINPGSISYPRDDGASYAILNISKERVEVQFFSLLN